jgi:general secretion pathway protein F
MRYGYRAYNASGALVEGEIIADSREMALDALHRRGEFPLEVADAFVSPRKSWWDRDIVLFRRVSFSGLALFTRELAMLVKADLPLDETLRIAALQPSLSASMRRRTERVLEHVLEGQSLSQALAAEGDAFPEFYWRLVRGGEASGTLADVLESLAVFLERSAEMRAKVLSAMLYPMILLGVAGLAITVIMAVLLPSIVPLLRDAGAQLPFVVRVLEDIREAVTGNLFLTAGIAAAFVAGIVALIATGTLGQFLSRLALRIPLFKGLVMRREVARFSRTLATLMKSGVPMLEALRVSGGVLANTSYRAVIEGVTEEVRQGAPLTRPLSASGYFPEVALRLIAVGEKTGQLETMLTRVADIFEVALQRQLDRMVALLTPLLTLGIGLLVGGLIVSVMGALLSINELAISQ